ncbi:MAG: LD-carboxypeptidase [Solobacterium sp.]|nr:LD-carboxypeptidase [Solobacterium sp.]
MKAIFCVRGGYAASEVMDILPLSMIANAGKLIIGYSDISVYHAAWTTAGLPSIHASKSAAFTDLPEACAEAERRLLKGEIPSCRCDSSSYCREGTAEGILIGGNLSAFNAVLGTPYDSSMDQPYIIFLEDVDEDLQHIHRFLTVLKHMGVFERAEGIIFGEWTDVPADSGDYSGNSRGGRFECVADMICREILEDLDIPVAFGFPAGHGDENYPMLFGETVRLDVSAESYTLEWAE